MAECKEAYDSGDYQRFIDIGVEDPNTGGPLFAAIHNEGCGATIVSQDQYPDSYGEPETMADTINALQPKIDEAAGAMLSAYQPFIGDVQLSQAIASINLFSPTALDAQDISAGMSAIQGAIEERMRDATGIEQTELQQSYLELKDAHQALREVIETDPSFAVLNDIGNALQADYGLSEPAVEQALQSDMSELAAPAQNAAPSMDPNAIKP